MGVRFVPMNCNALELFSQTVYECVPQEHLVRLVVDLVECADLHDIELAYSGRGSVACKPAMMLALLLYVYIMGLFWNRKL